MSAEKIDVLQVMDQSAARIMRACSGAYCAGLAVDMEQARAAVAELIERAEYVCRTGKGMIALRAALARIGGDA